MTMLTLITLVQLLADGLKKGAKRSCPMGDQSALLRHRKHANLTNYLLHGMEISGPPM
jgi:hypothetical protein